MFSSQLFTLIPWFFLHFLSSFPLCCLLSLFLNTPSFQTSLPSICKLYAEVLHMSMQEKLNFWGHACHWHWLHLVNHSFMNQVTFEEFLNETCCLVICISHPPYIPVSNSVHPPPGLNSDSGSELSGSRIFVSYSLHTSSEPGLDFGSNLSISLADVLLSNLEYELYFLLHIVFLSVLRKYMWSHIDSIVS